MAIDFKSLFSIGPTVCEAGRHHRGDHGMIWINGYELAPSKTTSSGSRAPITHVGVSVASRKGSGWRDGDQAIGGELVTRLSAERCLLTCK